MPVEVATVYRPRRPRESPLYTLVDECYDEVKGSWEERFERRYGHWRGTIEDAVFAFLNCGIYDHGFARVGCPECHAEYLVAFSCQRRGFCPSCAAKRGALFGAFLAEEVLEDVGHCLWTFTIPKMLRPYFRHHRHLLGELSKAAWEVVRELMATAVGDPGLRPGMVSVVHTHGDMLGWHPHVHAIASRGGWAADGSFTPVPFVDATGAEQLFGHQVITLLRDEGLLTEERIELLLSWRHSGFSAHNAVRIAAGDAASIERLARYLLRSPVALERMRLDAPAGEVHYQAKEASGRGPRKHTFEPVELLARLLQHVPEPRLHQVRYYGYYSNVARARRAPDTEQAASASLPEPTAAERKQLRRSWAQLIRRIYEVDPLVCRECGAEMRILAFILDSAVIRKILHHLDKKRSLPARAPPNERATTVS